MLAFKRRLRLVSLVAIALGVLLVAPGTAGAGPVILGGDDLHDHGSVDSAGNPQEGWLYMQRAIANLSPNVTRANDGSIAALGSSAAPASESGNGGAAIGVAGEKNGLPVNYYDGEAAINSFFQQLAAGQVNPRIIWIAGDGATNTFDESGGCNGTESAAVTNNAAQIDRFVSRGGGLMSHGTCYAWLSALLPGLTTVDSGGSDDLVLTQAGQQAFPGLTNEDVNAGPWHNHFDGNLGGLQVLVESTSVRNQAGGNAAVILGGSAVSITPPADLSITKSDRPDAATVGRNLTYTLRVRNNGPGSAAGVVVTDKLPAGLRSRSARATPGTCTGGTTVTCNVGTLAKGATATVRIVVRPTRSGTLTNVSTVETSGSDPNTANNTARETTRVRPGVRVTRAANRCFSGAFTARVRVSDAAAMRSVEVFVDGRRVRTTRSKSFGVVIRAAPLRAGRHVILAVARSSTGQRGAGARAFLRCARVSRPRFTG